MPYQQYTFNNADEVQTAAVAALEKSLNKGEVPVLLVPTSAAVVRTRRALADGRCAFGVRVETPSAWIADRWELFGDGRRIVEPGERELLVQRACDECVSENTEEAEELHPTPGTVALLARLAREALPSLPAACSTTPAQLTSAECAALRVLDRYAMLLDRAGLCEVSQAIDVLGVLMQQISPLVLAGFDEFDCAQELLWTRLAQRTDVLRFDDGCHAPDRGEERAPELCQLLERLFGSVAKEALKPTGAVRFLLPAGRYAQPSLVMRGVVQAVRRERDEAHNNNRATFPVVIAARDPRALFDAVADNLCAQGIEVALSARRTFADTAFGRAFLALLSFAYDETLNLSQATDFALSPFSGLSSRNAYALDAAWRGNRMVDHKHVAHDLVEASEDAALALAALAAGDVDGALEGFERRMLHRSDLDAAFRAEQLAAMSCARGFATSCARVGVMPFAARALLERATVSIHARTQLTEGDCPSAPEVECMSLADAAERAACSCSTLVLCDLEATSYPVKGSEDGRTLLMEKLGLCHPADALTETRRRFFRVLGTARDQVLCERVLNTENADESYPAVMYEELLDCYRTTEDLEDAVDKTTGLPACLAVFSATAGEEALHGNLTLTDSNDEGESWNIPRAGVVCAAGSSRIVLPPSGSRMRAELGAPTLTLSPSALESYLECPYKWFAQRRLRLAEPDAGFGALEMGSFSHGVLKSFYEHFRDAGQVKVNETNLCEAQALLGETFDRHLAFQPELKHNRNPLIPRTKFEQIETGDLRKKLMNYLDREACLLPRFEPSYFEYDFGSAEPFAYAGCWLRGSVDRIDVNSAGQAVVIDYKGSLSDDYALSSSSPAAQAGQAVLPHKVQALIYAQVARRVLGLDVVGALYVSYGRDGRISGAFDRTVLGEDSLPGINTACDGVPGPAGEAMGAETFAQLVDLVEERIACATQTLARGIIGPDPRGTHACKYCPVLTCERRLGV